MPFLQTLREYWGYDSFRGRQLDIIRSISGGRDTLVLMPTGGGKSLTFQVPTLCMQGLCLVITPLIALMKDQVDHLRLRGISAYAIYAGLSRQETLQILDNCLLGHVKFLYVAPERLSSEVFRTKLRRMNVCFVAVDEAHCISEWGYDFRPAYLEIGQIRELLPASTPLLALTATATPRVVDDIVRQLHLRDPQIFREPLARPNLRYVVRHASDKEAELLHILRSLSGSAIVYTRSRNKTEEIAARLEQQGISALFYHAGLKHVDKEVRQQAWQQGQVRVMVATNAFGMGIDKADVRLVVHIDLPDSLEAYIQEAGRAGRDRQTAYAVLLYNHNDRRLLHLRIEQTFPPADFIKSVYEKLAYSFQLAAGDGYETSHEFRLDHFCRTFHFFPLPVISSLAILERAGYLRYSEAEESRSRVMFLLTRDQLYSLPPLPSRREAVVKALLRRCCGLFSDYIYIDETEIGELTGQSAGEVYENLLTLTRQRILHYIPRRNVAHITYLQRRVEQQRLHLPHEVYTDRRRIFQEQIEAILNYAEEDSQCRSQHLTAYFGDTDTPPCGHCDVCLQKREAPVDTTAAETAILQVLADGQSHQATELRIDGCSRQALHEALESLSRRGLIRLENGCFRKS
ncbi:MAG: ATP-dependent DNA helicase RecQ [Alloprevotella sp.]